MASVRPGFLSSDLSLVGRSYAGGGSQVAPAAGTVIAQTEQMPGGLYRVRVWAAYGGTPDAINNMVLQVGSRNPLPLFVIAAANAAPPMVEFERIPIYDGERISVVNVAAGVAGSVYNALIAATPLAQG